MKCEHDTRTLELPGLGEPAKGLSLQRLLQQRANLELDLVRAETKPANTCSKAGRGAYKVKMNASSHAMRRVAAGLTMKELAKRAGVSLRTLERLEGQGGDISLESRRAIRAALDQAEASR